MLKLLGALLLAGGAAAVGFSAAAQLGRRVKALRALLGALELMERELAFRLTPMPELFRRLADQAAPPVGTFFARCLAGLDSLGEKPFAQIWREALGEAPMGLGERELSTLRELGDVLGHYDGAGQQEALSLARGQLEQDLRLAREDGEKQGRMYRVLGVTAGAFLVILLL